MHEITFSEAACEIAIANLISKIRTTLQLPSLGAVRDDSMPFTAWTAACSDVWRVTSRRKTALANRELGRVVVGLVMVLFGHFQFCCFSPPPMTTPVFAINEAGIDVPRYQGAMPEC